VETCRDDKKVTADVAVSVIIPAYNAAERISATLDSVLSQTFQNFEILVINDGSPDTERLEEILDSYRTRIIYIKQVNRGAAAARNAGIRSARAPLVAFLDADDSWLPDYLAEQIKFLESDEGYDVVYADALIEGGPPYGGRTYMEIAPSEGEVTFASLATQKCGVITSGVVARKQMILDVGLFDETLQRAHDYDLWLRLSKAGARFNYQRRVLLRYSYHTAGLSGDAVTHAERDLIVLEKTLKRQDLTLQEREALEARFQQRHANLLLERGKAHLAVGEFYKAENSFHEANQYLKSIKLNLVLHMLRFTPNLLQWAYRRRR